MQKLLTIIICTYNRLNYLKLVLLSLASCQDIDEVKVLIVNNSDLPDTRNFLDNFLAKNQAMDIQTENIPSNGLSNARNHAIEVVDTPYLVFFDDDCIIHPHCLKELLQYVQINNPKVFTGRVNSVLPFNKLNCVSSKELATSTNSNIEVSYLPGNFLGIKKSIIAEVGKFDENYGPYKAKRGYGDDTVFEWKVRKKGITIHYVSTSLVYHLSLGFDYKEWYSASKEHGFYHLKVRDFLRENKSSMPRIWLKSIYNLLKILIRSIFRGNVSSKDKFSLIREIGTLHGYYKYVFNR